MKLRPDSPPADVTVTCFLTNTLPEGTAGKKETPSRISEAEPSDTSAKGLYSAGPGQLALSEVSPAVQTRIKRPAADFSAPGIIGAFFYLDVQGHCQFPLKFVNWGGLLGLARWGRVFYVRPMFA